MIHRYQRWFCVLFVILFMLCSGNAQDSPVAGTSYRSADVPDTPAGLQLQVHELIRGAQTHDEVNWRVALDTFSLPNADTWFRQKFAAEHVAQLTQDYPKVRDGHLGHLSWVIGHNQNAPGFSIPSCNLRDAPAAF